MKNAWSGERQIDHALSAPSSLALRRQEQAEGHARRILAWMDTWTCGSCHRKSPRRLYCCSACAARANAAVRSSPGRRR